MLHFTSKPISMQNNKWLQTQWENISISKDFYKNLSGSSYTRIQYCKKCITISHELNIDQI